MPAAMRHEVADQVAARQRQVADQVQELVPHTFVRVTQLVLQRPLVGKHEQVLGTCPLAEALGPEPISLGFEHEGPAGRQLAA